MIEKLYTIKEAAEILRVTPRSVFRFIQPEYKNQLKASKVGGTWRITEKDLNDFISNYTKNGKGDK